MPDPGGRPLASSAIRRSTSNVLPILNTAKPSSDSTSGAKTARGPSTSKIYTEHRTSTGREVRAQTSALGRANSVSGLANRHRRSTGGSGRPPLPMLRGRRQTLPILFDRSRRRDAGQRSDRLKHWDHAWRSCASASRCLPDYETMAARLVHRAGPRHAGLPKAQRPQGGPFRPWERSGIDASRARSRRGTNRDFGPSAWAARRPLSPVYPWLFGRSLCYIDARMRRMGAIA